MATYSKLQVPDGSGSWENVKVKVPAGVSDGTRMRVRGKGGTSLTGGPRGNLFLVINIKAHPVFSRSGTDINCDVPVPISVMVLGGSSDVPVLSGTKRVKIRPGTQPGTRVRLKGHGVPAKSGPSGDLYVRLMPVFPDKISDRSKELFSELAGEGW